MRFSSLTGLDWSYHQQRNLQTTIHSHVFCAERVGYSTSTKHIFLIHALGRQIVLVVKSQGPPLVYFTTKIIRQIFYLSGQH